MTEEELFPLDPEKIYYSMDELTLDTEEGPVTLKLGAWLNVDPVRIHQMIEVLVLRFRDDLAPWLFRAELVL